MMFKDWLKHGFSFLHEGSDTFAVFGAVGVPVRVHY
jgi:hypothetical protein